MFRNVEMYLLIILDCKVGAGPEGQMFVCADHSPPPASEREPRPFDDLMSGVMAGGAFLTLSGAKLAVCWTVILPTGEGCLRLCTPISGFFLPTPGGLGIQPPAGKKAAG